MFWKETGVSFDDLLTKLQSIKKYTIQYLRNILIYL